MRVVLWIAGVCAGVVSGCGGAVAQRSEQSAAPPAPAATSPEAAAPASAGAVKPGGPAQATCPVSGEKFSVKADGPRVDHHGQTVHFCCPGCLGKFNANPQKYTTATGAARQPNAETGDCCDDGAKPTGGQ